MYINGDVTSHDGEEKERKKNDSFLRLLFSERDRSCVNNASAVFVRSHTAENLPRAARYTQADLALVSFGAFLLEGHCSGIMVLFHSKEQRKKTPPFFPFNRTLQGQTAELDCSATVEACKEIV